MQGKLEIFGLELGQLQTNCYFIVEPSTKKVVVVDPADEGDRIWRKIQKEEWHLDTILVTHGHYDHIGGVASLKELSGAGVWIHEHDAEMLDSPDKNFSSFLGTPYACRSDGRLQEGQIIEIGNSEIRVLHTPGHTRGSTSFQGDGFVMVGDTLFRGSIGRTDFPGSSHETLITSIREKFMVLEDHTRVYPGHGPATTIGDERNGNPFLVGTKSYI